MQPVTDAQLREHLPMVRALAWRYAQRCPPWVSREDLEQAGAMGLLAALRGHDAARGASVATHAWQRVRGAILDALRASDPLSRRERARGLSVCEVGLDQAPEHADDDADPAQMLAVRQEAAQLAAALAGLPEREHAALAAALDSSDEKLAEQWGVSSSRVVQLRRRAVGRLRQAMAAR